MWQGCVQCQYVDQLGEGVVCLFWYLIDDQFYVQWVDVSQVEVDGEVQWQVGVYFGGEQCEGCVGQCFVDGVDGKDVIGCEVVGQVGNGEVQCVDDEVELYGIGQCVEIGWCDVLLVDQVVGCVVGGKLQ